MSRGRPTPPRSLQPFGLLPPPFGRLATMQIETVRPGVTDPQAIAHIESVERDLETLRDRVSACAREYESATGKGADGAKARALAKLFGEPEPVRGRRFDAREMAIDYERLRRQSDPYFELRRTRRELVIWIAEKGPLSREKALEGVAWLHDAANAGSVAQTLRRFARAQALRRLASPKNDPLDRIDDILARLEEDFRRRKPSKFLTKPALRQLSGNKSRKRGLR
jgi:hypothetical protein